MTALGLGLSLPFLVGRGGAAPDPDATALIARMSPEPSTAGKSKIDRFVKAYKASGAWATREAIYVPGFDDTNWSSGQAETNAKLNWRKNAYNLTAAGSVTFTRGRGFKGNGVDATLSSGYVPGVALGLLGLNSVGVEVWNLANVAENLAAIGVGPSTRAIHIQPRTTPGNFIGASLNDGTTRQTSVVPGTAVGLSAASRDNASTYKAFKDGAQLGTDLTTTSNLLSVTQPISLLSRGGADQFSNAEVAFGSFGAAMTPAQVAGAYEAVRTLLSAGSTTKVHVLGDSFADTPFLRQMNLASADPYRLVTLDGVGGSTLGGQAIRFAATPQYYDRTLLILDGGLTDDPIANGVAAINEIVGRLTHSRWLYIAPGVKDTETAGSSDRAAFDARFNAVVAAIGESRVIRWLTQAQAANDGSPTDLADVANDIVPTSLRADGHHLNDAGKAVLAGVVATRIQSLGW